MSKIVVVGSCNTDMVVRTSKFPVPGETILGGEFFMFLGGKGANQAVAAARMGSQVTFICKTGNDVFGKRSVEEFVKEGINTEYIKVDPQKASGTALILVDESGENEIVVASGANETLSVANIAAAEKELGGSDVILMQLEIPMETVLYTAQRGYGLGKKVILNPAPAMEIPDELFGCLFLITPNETEAEILTGIKVSDKKSMTAAAQKLLELGVDNVIITMGSEGAFFKNAKTEMHIKAPRVNAVDTTAAGDVFNGVMAVELTSGNGWRESITRACRAASISVTKMGAQASMPYRKDIEEPEQAIK